ncbi:MAG: type II 3-dehydroquinate dehydratase, partial [Gemmatimonadota bacterium]
IIDFIVDAAGRVDGFLINPGGLTHTSVVLRDALVGVGRPFVEIHISNTASREDFRRNSYLSPVASGVVFGFGAHGYLLALRGLVSQLSES